MPHPFDIPIQFHYHAAAITLNNTGVSLVERQCYRQAMEVFKDGVSLMKVVSSSLMSSKQEHQQPSDQEVKIQQEQQALASWPNAQEMLRKASHSVFHPKPDVGSMSSSSSSSSSSLGAIYAMVKVVTLDEIAATVQQALLRGQQAQEQESSPSSSDGQVPSPFILIRVESSALGAGTTTFSGSLAAAPTSINTSSHMFDVDSSILLYNLGVAFECMASCSATTAATATATNTTTTRPTTSWIFEECHKSALSLFELSFHIFHGNFWVRQQLVSSPHQQDRETHRRVEYLPLLIIFLMNLVRLFPPTSSSSGVTGRVEESTTAADRQEAFRLNLIQACEIFLHQPSYLEEYIMAHRDTAPAA